MNKKSYIQVYTGDGKGKTTAALGLAVRGLGAGMSVYVGQFLKKGKYSEWNFFANNKSKIKIEQFGSRDFIGINPSKKDKDLAKKGFARVKNVLNSGKYDLVILDEINIALKYKLLSVKEVINVLKTRPQKTEIVLTGRDALPEIKKIADLVTEMKMKKHYYLKGVKARVGIEK